MDIKFTVKTIEDEFYVFFGNKRSHHLKLKDLVDQNENILAPGTRLHISFEDDTPEHIADALKNYRAVLNKGWQYVFPGCERPYNPWVSGTLQTDTPRVSTTETSVEFTLNLSGTPMKGPVFRALVWKLVNAAEWSTFPNRKRLSGRAPFTRETWEAISIHRNSEILKKDPQQPQPQQNEQSQQNEEQQSISVDHESGDSALGPVAEA